MDFLNSEFLNNPISTWIIAAVVIVLVFIVVSWLKDILHIRLSKSGDASASETKKFLSSLLERTGKFFILVLALYAGSLTLSLPENIHAFLRTGMIAVALLQIAFWGGSLIDFLVNRQIQGEMEEKAAQATSLNALKLVAKIALWTIIILLILENLTGVEINALIASLGVTGVAVALAVQNILGDLFASLSIALDKPFVIGDAITVGEFSGTVEHIGLKSTRVRSISGEQVVFSNSDLLNSRIQNLRSMTRRRVAFMVGATYETPFEKLEKIPQIVQEIFKDLEDITLDRVHLKEMGNFSLNFEIVYFVETADIYRYLDLQHSINLELLRKFAQEGIAFAYPTQTLYMEKTNPTI